MTPADQIDPLHQKGVKFAMQAYRTDSNGRLPRNVNVRGLPWAHCRKLVVLPLCGGEIGAHLNRI